MDKQAPGGGQDCKPGWHPKRPNGTNDLSPLTLLEARPGQTSHPLAETSEGPRLSSPSQHQVSKPPDAICEKSRGEENEPQIIQKAEDTEISQIGKFRFALSAT